MLWEPLGDDHCISPRPQEPPGIPTACQPDPGIPGDTHCMSARPLGSSGDTYCTSAGPWDPQGYPLHVTQALGSLGIPTAHQPDHGIPGDAHCTPARPWDPRGYPLHISQALALLVAQTLSCAVVRSCLWLPSLLLLDNTNLPNRGHQWCASGQVNWLPSASSLLSLSSVSKTTNKSLCF